MICTFWIYIWPLSQLICCSPPLLLSPFSSILSPSVATWTIILAAVTLSNCRSSFSACLHASFLNWLGLLWGQKFTLSWVALFKCIILLDSLLFAKPSLTWVFSRSYVPCAPFSMLGIPDGTGCDEVHFPVHGDWDSRDVSVAELKMVHMSSKCFC